MEHTNNETYWERVKKAKNNANLCFIHTPKCGGTYASQVLRYLKIRNKGHSLANENDGITFTIIRNPVERFESFLNYRLGGRNKPLGNWPKHLHYVFHDKSMTLNEIVGVMSDEDILGFRPYHSLTYWSKNIDVFITIDKLHSFLSYFGYNYNTDRFKKQNVSKKNRGSLDEAARSRISRLYSGDMLLFESTVA